MLSPTMLVILEPASHGTVRGESAWFQRCACQQYCLGKFDLEDIIHTESVCNIFVYPAILNRIEGVDGNGCDEFDPVRRAV